MLPDTKSIVKAILAHIYEVLLELSQYGSEPEDLTWDKVSGPWKIIIISAIIISLIKEPSQRGHTHDIDIIVWPFMIHRHWDAEKGWVWEWREWEDDDQVEDEEEEEEEEEEPDMEPNMQIWACFNYDQQQYANGTKRWFEYHGIYAEKESDDNG